MQTKIFNFNFLFPLIEQMQLGNQVVAKGFAVAAGNLNFTLYTLR
jgi:hypothetical protein